MTNIEMIERLKEFRAMVKALSVCTNIPDEAVKGDMIPDIEALSHAIELLEAEEKGEIVRMPKSGIGDLSDGYHTFNELYHHRAVLFSVICNSMPDKAWKSKKHDDGSMFDKMFIVGIETPSGQATYHYDIVPYWDMFKVKELDFAPKWDGHTPAQAIERIGKLTESAKEAMEKKEEQ